MTKRLSSSAHRRLEEIVDHRFRTGRYLTNIYDRVLGDLARAGFVEVVRLDPYDRRKLKMRWDVEPFDHAYDRFPKLRTMHAVRQDENDEPHK